VERYEVVGAGGIGCAVGYALRAAGALVTFVDADAEKVEWGRRHGVCIDQRPPLAADFETFDAWKPATDRPILLCTKCYNNPAVLARLPDSATVIPIQNGFDRIFDRRAPFVEGIASFVSECYPGRTHTRITRKGRLHLGIRGRETGERSLQAGPQRGEMLRMLASGLAAAAFRVEVVDDILPYKHTKLMYNAAIGPVAAAAGLDNGQLLAVPQARQWFFGLLRENYAILKDANLTLGKIGPFHPVTVSKILRQTRLARMLSWAFYPTLRHTYCSMNADLVKGQTEIDCYNGYLIELAHDRPCPLNRQIYELVKRMERERLEPGVRVLDDMHVGARAMNLV
jgi:2-dehydropantoate 2-reductase